MTEALITKVKNNSVSLPKNWKGARVFVRTQGNTATITKIPLSKKVFNEVDVKKLRLLGKKVTKSTLNKALKVAR
jgi:hypothetical protein